MICDGEEDEGVDDDLRGREGLSLKGRQERLGDNDELLVLLLETWTHSYSPRRLCWASVQNARTRGDKGSSLRQSSN